METRRRFIDALGRMGLAGAVAPLVSACAGLRPAPAKPSAHYDLVVIGTGFGGTLAALRTAFALDNNSQRLGKPPLQILMLERGTWWTTPTETLQDKQVKTRDFLVARGQPTQEWSSLGDYRGMLDLIERCRRSEQRPQGLYDFAMIGQRRNDGVAVLRASGVGGGSLVYSKILMRPPESLFDDPRWPGAWGGRAGAALRNGYFRRALACVTRGVETLEPGRESASTGLAGPSNILARSPGHAPAAVAVDEPLIARAEPQRKLLQIRIAPNARLQGREPDLIDRARVFQTAMSGLTRFYGTVDLSINEMSIVRARPGARPGEREPTVGNYCERSGRCNVGCLPGAGQTLNKQLLRAIYGGVDSGSLDRKPMREGPCLFRNVVLQLHALAEVEHLSKTDDDGPYRIHYLQRRAEDPAGSAERVAISADRVILAAGSLGTSELLLRSRQHSLDSGGKEGLAYLSAALGNGFSPNGDHIAFLTDTAERVNLTYGPVTTSFAQFKPDAPRAAGFHNVEDQGVPRALASLVGHGVPVIQRLASGNYVGSLLGGIKLLHKVTETQPERRQAAAVPADMSADRPESEDELTSRMMCVVAQGKDDAAGRFWLERGRLRVARPDGVAFHEDKIYDEIEATLDRLAQRLRPGDAGAKFVSPLSKKLFPGVPTTVMTSHPLGGCPMGRSADDGVVDESGRVFRQEPGRPGVYEGLYIADGSMIPTALGVNPALTISAVALRVADKVVAEWGLVASRPAEGGGALHCARGAAA
jgi:choline dehydrogenase-like flavoprotein